MLCLLNISWASYPITKSSRMWKSYTQIVNELTKLFFLSYSDNHVLTLCEPVIIVDKKGHAATLGGGEGGIMLSVS